MSTAFQTNRVDSSANRSPIRYRNVEPITAGQFVMIDGTNIILQDSARPSLETLLGVTLEVIALGCDFGCIFDANTWYTLRDRQSMSHAAAYRELLNCFRQHFSEVTGGTRADDVILPEAQARSAIILSNDKFHDYERVYPWVTRDARVIRLNCFRGHLHFAGRRLRHLNILDDLMTELTQRLSDAEGAIEYL